MKKIKNFTMLEFDNAAKRCLKLAAKVAKEIDNDSTIRVPHLAYAILADRRTNRVITTLEELNIDVDLMTEKVENIRKETIIDNKSEKTPEYDKELGDIIDYSKVNYIKLKDKKLATVNDLFHTILLNKTDLSPVFEYFKLSAFVYKETAFVVETEFSSDFFDENLQFLDNYQTIEYNPTKIKVEDYYTNKVQLAKKGLIDDCIGRADELEQLYRVLSRKRKSNAIIVGEAGVGKTNLVDGLASSIANETSPYNLENHKVCELNLNKLIAGTKYRGDFEKRVEEIIEHLVKDGNIILYIDEIHNILGAGNSEGSMDMANILKPYLSRDGLQIIGSTTSKEYRMYISKDKALSRRFSKITLEPPSKEVTLKILQRVKPSYEQKHKVVYSKGALNEIVELTDKYIPYKNFPDKALDLLDEVASDKILRHRNAPLLNKLQQKYKNLEKNKVLIVKSKDYLKAKAVKDKSNALIEKIRALRVPPKTPKTVTTKDVRDTFKSVYNISVDGGLPLESIEKSLKRSVIGQDKAIKSIINTLEINNLGLDEHDKPIGSFLFVGYSGVGKTQIVKTLSNSLFNHESKLSRFDCSEYSQAHEVSKLIGSPSGYVGYENGGILTNKVKENPFSVILFDEIEKAHPKFFDILLQILGEGHLTDNQGEKVDFKNTLVVMTSNVGIKNSLEQINSIGFNKTSLEYDKLAVEKEMESKFSVEFLNRIDEIVHFKPLSRENLMKILDLHLSSLKLKCEKHGLLFELTGKLKDYLINKCYDPKNGFRPLRREINKSIKPILAKEILKKSKEVTLSLQGETIITL